MHYNLVRDFPSFSLSSVHFSLFFLFLFVFAIMYLKLCNRTFYLYFNSTARKLPIKKCMGKIAVQLKSHGESEIARVSVHACRDNLGNVQFE